LTISKDKDEGNSPRLRTAAASVPGILFLWQLSSITASSIFECKSWSSAIRWAAIAMGEHVEATGERRAPAPGCRSVLALSRPRLRDFGFDPAH
jgi:hypothetical protein